MSHTNLSLTEHQQIGATVKSAMADMHAAQAKFQKHYGHNHKLYRATDAVLRALDHLRNIADNAVCAEQPHTTEPANRAIISCYYGAK